MDKYEVKLLSRALRDLDGIYGYIAQNLQEPGIASDLIDELETQILSLEYLPFRCPERRTGVYANKGYLCEKAGISPASVTKMGRNGFVTTEVLEKICVALECQIGDVMEIIPEEK